jgi:hypothetical protein
MARTCDKIGTEYDSSENLRNVSTTYLADIDDADDDGWARYIAHFEQET